MDRRELLASLLIVGTSGCLRMGEGESGPQTSAPTSTGVQRGSPTQATQTQTIRETEEPTATPDSTSTTSEPDRQRPTETETETETETTAEEDVEAPPYPTGLNSDGVSEFLLGNHLNNLLPTSFTMNFTSQNVSESYLTENTEVKFQDGRALKFQRDHEPYVTKYINPDSTQITWQTEIDGRRIYGRASRSDLSRARRFLEAAKDRWSFLYWAVNGGDYDQPTYDPDADLFRITSNRIANAELLRTVLRADQVEQFTATGSVSTEGIVRSLETDVDTIREGELIREVSSYEVSKIGETTISPDWLGTAREQAPQINASVVDNRQYLRLEHEGGQPTIADTELYLKGESEPLNRQFEPGESLFAALDGGSNLRLQFGSKPDVTDPTSLDRGGISLPLRPVAAAYLSASINAL